MYCKNTSLLVLLRKVFTQKLKLWLYTILGGFAMMEIDRSKILKDLFEYFPELQEVWIKGDLEHFSNAELIVDDTVDYGDVWRYLAETHHLYDKEMSLGVFQKSLCTEIETEFTHYTREECYA